MRKTVKNALIILSVSLLITTCITSSVFAQSTTPQKFSSTLADTLILENEFGSLSANINTDTGTISNTLDTAFKISSNKEDGKYLTQSWTCNTSGSTQNAIFSSGSQAYVILTNTNSLPTVNAVNDIKSASPSALSNSNAIAYAIDAPTAVANKLTVTFNSSANNWSLHILKNGTVRTSQTIPVGSPLSQTYSNYDEPGGYQATVTLSFDP